jgi:hypothetical protein
VYHSLEMVNRIVCELAWHARRPYDRRREMNSSSSRVYRPNGTMRHQSFADCLDNNRGTILALCHPSILELLLSLQPDGKQRSIRPE